MHVRNRDFAELIDIIAESIILIDTRARILEINRTAAERLGDSIENLVGRDFMTLMPPALALARRVYFDEALLSRQAVRFEDERDGMRFAITVYPVLEEGRRVDRLLIFARDITEQTRAAEALRKSEELSRIALTSSRDFIAVLDEEGRIDRTNAWNERLPGLDDGAFLGADFAELWQGEDQAAARQALVNARLGRPGSFEGIFLPTGGAPRWWNVAVNRLGDSPKKPFGYLVVARDITERRRMIEERYAAVEEEALLGRLAGAVAHKVNNPLFAIRMQVNALARDLPPDAKIEEKIRIILEQADRIESTTRALLGLVRRSGGRERADLAQMLRSLLLLYESDFTAQGIRCAIELPESLRVERCDGDRMKQAFIGLIEYGRRALSPGGHFSLKGAATETAVEITLEHDGVGLGDQPELIFMPCSLAAGSGMGLAVVKRTIEQHGGAIAAENRSADEGGGARIRICLPNGAVRSDNVGRET